MDSMDNAMEFAPDNDNMSPMDMGAMAPMAPFPPFPMPGMPFPGFEADRKDRKDKKKKDRKEKKDKKHRTEEEKEERRKEKKEKKRKRDGEEGEDYTKRQRSDENLGMPPMMPPFAFPGMPPMPIPGNMMVNAEGKTMTMAKPINLAELPQIDAMRSMGKMGHQGEHRRPKSKLNPPNPQNDPNYPDSFANRRARELYVGGLLAGGANRQNIKQFFSEILHQLPEFVQKYASHPQYAGAVKEITISDGSFAFVEFWTEELAATVIEFDGVHFEGRNLKIGRPAKFIPNGPLAPPMDVQELRVMGVLPPQRSSHANMPGYGGKNTPLMRSLSQQDRELNKARYHQNPGNVDEEGDQSGSNASGKGKGKGKGGSGRSGQNKLQGLALAEKKARELYVGNLPVNLCNDEALRDLFTPACKMLPTFHSAAGPPVLSVDVRGGGTFAFVEFQNELMASEALNIFNKMEVGGRQINVGRPSGYEGPTENAATNYGIVRQPSNDATTPMGSTNNTPANTPPPNNAMTPSNNGDMSGCHATPPPPPGHPMSPGAAMGSPMTFDPYGMPQMDPHMMQDPNMQFGMDPNMMHMQDPMMMQQNQMMPNQMMMHDQQPAMTPEMHHHMQMGNPNMHQANMTPTHN